MKQYDPYAELESLKGTKEILKRKQFSSKTDEEFEYYKRETIKIDDLVDRVNEKIIDSIIDSIKDQSGNEERKALKEWLDGR